MQPFSLNIKGELKCFDTPAVMGILNCTPDSFYAESRMPGVLTGSIDEKSIATRVEKMICDGADIIDIGGVSTRPGAVAPDEEEELKRIEKILKITRDVCGETLVSVDTFRASVARKSVEWGADIINDISGGNLDPEMFETVAELRVPYVLTHSRGGLEDMMEYTDYEMVTRDVLSELGDRLQQLSLLGVNDVIIDPGFGFSKTLDQNYRLLADIGLFELFHRPVMVGFSRKSMITNLLQIQAAGALNGTTVLNTLALDRGASILRVHDVREAKETVRIYQKLVTCPVLE